MRGKRDFAAAYRRDPRITPADAGKTFSHTTLPHSGQDHPRRCGENNLLFDSWTFDLGSPPQVRGKRGLSGCDCSDLRITPAGAGKTADEFSLLVAN